MNAPAGHNNPPALHAYALHIEDLFAMADIGAYTAGMPRAEYLKRVL